jgi:hypothetical protein
MVGKIIMSIFTPNKQHIPLTSEQGVMTIFSGRCTYHHRLREIKKETHMLHN